MPESPFKLNYSEIKGSPPYSTAAAFQRHFVNAVSLEPDVDFTAIKKYQTPRHENGSSSQFRTTPLLMDSTMARALDIARREVAVTYERKIKDLEDFWSRKIIELHEKHAASQSGAEHGIEMNVKSREDKLTKTYNKRLRKFEQDLRVAFDAFTKRNLVLQGALDESRREVEAAAVSSQARENSLKDELSLVLDRCKSYKEDLLELQEERYYHQKWQKCASALAETIIKLSNSSQPPDKHGSTRLAAAFRSFGEDETEEVVCVNREIFQRCLKLSKKITERIKFEEEDKMRHLKRRAFEN